MDIIARSFYHNSTFKQAMYILYWMALSCKHQKQHDIPYYRKLTLYEIKVLEINAT